MLPETGGQNVTKTPFLFSLLLVIGIVGVAGADEYATTSSGKRVLLRDNGTWVAVEEHPASPTTGNISDAEQVLRQKCQREWQNDFRMQEYCQRQQREAIRALSRGKPQDIPEGQFAIVRNKCAGEWPDDYRMREYCERQQYEAIRKLR
jgi:hypothetical protein